MPTVNPLLKEWIAQQLKCECKIEPLQGDASFRSYFRVYGGLQTYIAMLAPPEQEKTDEFVNIAKAWASENIEVPKIIAWDQPNGYVLLSDFGDSLLLEHLSSQNVDGFYIDAMQSILKLQTTQFPLPAFDQTHIQNELFLFKDWFLEKWLNFNLTNEQLNLINNTNQLLVDNCLEQPQVVIHRDYHSRNLMILNQNKLGIIDFQDAMRGPITYDLVSLLKDCYIQWPREQVISWCENFHQNVYKQHINPPSVAQFLKWFDLTGLQRHLKVLGIFARLNIRDGKPRYLADMPRIMDYVLEVASSYPEFEELKSFLSNLTSKLTHALDKVA